MARARRFYAYARFSPRPNAEECESCERQEQDIRAWCESRGFQLTDAFHDESLSGGTDDARLTMDIILDERPGLAQALCSCKRGDTLLVRSFDRLSRSVDLLCFVATELRSRGAELVSITESTDLTLTPNGKLMMQMRVAMAEYERAMIRLRTAVGMRRAQANGRAMSRTDRLPYGMKEGKPEEITLPNGTKKNRRLIVPDEEEQSILEHIYRMHKEGLSQHEIARKLNAAGMLCRGGLWWQTTIRGILKRAGLLQPKKVA